MYIKHLTKISMLTALFLTSLCNVKTEVETIANPITVIEEETTTENYELPTTQEITRDIPIEKMLECLGSFKLTAYCSCEKCCGVWALNRPDGIVYGCAGEELRAGYSIATDLEVLPLGTEVYIDGVVYKVQDCGGGVKGKHIDIYFDTHEEALRFNTRIEEVYKW